MASEAPDTVGATIPVNRERRRELRWSWSKFFIKITSRQFFIWLATTLISYHILLRDGDHDWIKYVIFVWGFISAVFLMGHTVVDAVSTAVSKADIKVNVGK